MRQITRRSIFLSKVWLLTAAIRLALWVLPFATVQRLVTRLGRRNVSDGTRGRPPETFAWAVEHSARFVPRATCLTRALVMHVLLSRAGHAPRLRIGLAQVSPGELRAHAWLENMGEVVIGAPDSDRFNPLPTLERT